MQTALEASSEHSLLLFGVQAVLGALIVRHGLGSSSTRESSGMEGKWEGRLS